MHCCRVSPIFAGILGHFKRPERLASFLASVQLKEEGDHLFKIVLLVVIAIFVIEWCLRRLTHILEEHLESSHVWLRV